VGPRCDAPSHRFVSLHAPQPVRACAAAKAADDIIRANERNIETMKAMKLIWLMATWIGLAGMAPHAAFGQWEQPAGALADQIAAILGAGQAHLSIRNLSSIPTDEIPAIRRLLTQDLKARGVTLAGSESANAVRVTLSENIRELLWVAEVVEGNQSQVAIVDAGPVQPQQAQAAGGLTLVRHQVVTFNEPVLATLQNGDWLAALTPEALVLYERIGDAWKEQRRERIIRTRGLARDPQGRIVPEQNDNSTGFEAFLGATRCTGTLDMNGPAREWQARCADSDDPWVISDETGAQNPSGTTPPRLKAFFNAARNYFSGVVSPSFGVDLPPFYSAALVPRAGGSTALLIAGIDGKVQLAENNMLHSVAGTRDWGSDFAALYSGCGAGMQIIASGSGQAANDSLRAFEVPTLEAIPASAPLAMAGTVTALWSAPDGKSVLAVVHNMENQFEVDRVTALCN
jgi:hypothetical protein